MSLEDRIRIVILTRSKSIRGFCVEHGLQYTTIMSALTRGIQNASFSTVADLAHALGLEADDLTSEEKFIEVTEKSANQHDILEFVKNDPDVRMVAKIGKQLSDDAKRDLRKYAELLRNQRDRSDDD